jgi:hypothetical protein
MKIKKINEDFESDILHNNDEIQKLKKTLSEVWSDYDNFDDFWVENGDKIILDLNLIKNTQTDNNQKGNIREILPTMVRVSKNSKITNIVANNVVDNFSKAELIGFKLWLKQIEQGIQFNKNNNRRW